MKKLLLIIDAQNDFVTGSLAVEGSKEAMSRLNDYILDNIEDIQMIMFTKDWHPANHISFVENGGQWPKHCVINTEGSSILPELLRAAALIFGIFIVHKGIHPDKEEYSAFTEPNANVLKALDGANIIEVAGIAGDFCVHDSVVDLINLGYKDKLVICKEYIASTDGGEKLDKLINDYNLKCK